MNAQDTEIARGLLKKYVPADIFPNFMKVAMSDEPWTADEQLVKEAESVFVVALTASEEPAVGAKPAMSLMKEYAEHIHHMATLSLSTGLPVSKG